MYRTSADPTLEEARETARALAVIARAAHARRSRARLAVGAVLLGAFAIVGVGTAVARPAPRAACHRVVVVWENAPERPADEWTTCGAR